MSTSSNSLLKQNQSGARPERKESEINADESRLVKRTIAYGNADNEGATSEHEKLPNVSSSSQDENLGRRMSRRKRAKVSLKVKL